MSATNVREAIIFDMDGIIIDSEETWQRARLAVVAEYGGTYHDGVAEDVMGMSPGEWSRYMRENIGVPLEDDRIRAEVMTTLERQYRATRPFFPGAVETVKALAKRWPVGLASASARELIDLVAELGGLGDTFSVTLSTSEAGRGKPSPDVYLEAARRLGIDPAHGIAVEDSSNGIRSANAAGLKVVGIPTPAFPLAPDALAMLDIRLSGIRELTPDVVATLFAR